MTQRRQMTSSLGLALLLVCALVQWSGPTALAAQATAEPSTEIVQSVSLSDVDCLSESVCFAVGVHRYAEQRTDEIGDVFYTTADRPLVVQKTTDGWREMSFPAIPQQHSEGDLFVNGAASEISCVGTARRVSLRTTYCVVIGGYTTHFPQGDGMEDDNGPMTAAWNGTAWRLLQRPVEGCLGGCYEERHDVQCVAAKACYSLSRNISGQTAERLGTWDGRKWTHERIPEFTGESQPLSCWAVRRCVAVSSTQLRGTPRRYRSWAHVLDGRRWRSDRLPGKNVYVGGLSCRGATNCVAVGNNVSVFGNPRSGGWQRVPMRGDKSWFADVSCAGSRCVAVGSVELEPPVRAAQTFDGRVWSSATPPTPDGARTWLTHVDCPRSSLCFATGLANGRSEDEQLLQWDGDEWRYVPLSVRAYHPPV